MNPSAELGRIAASIETTASRTGCPGVLPMLEWAASLRAVAAGIESATAGDALGMLEKLAEAGSYCEADVIISAPCRGSAEWVVTNHDGKDGAGPTLRAAIRAAATGGEG